jgi:2-polyprenyl-3-methyl-5-hydroxy-6-metoxy-1,4-benzoquinol methylase
MSPTKTSEGPSDRLRDVYERRAALEYPEPVGLPDPAVDRKFERLVETVASRLPCERFLDAGCGDGRYLAALASLRARPRHIVGTDIAERILVTARRATADAGIEAELVRANLEALPFEDASFDLVLCTQVIEHLLDPSAGVRELARVVRPGGSVIVSTDNRRALVSRALNAPRAGLVRLLRLSGRRKQVDFPHASFGARDVVAMLRDAGLEPAHTETFRFHVTGGGPAIQRLLNRLDKALPPHGVGDILLVVARKR